MTRVVSLLLLMLAFGCSSSTTSLSSVPESGTNPAADSNESLADTDEVQNEGTANSQEFVIDVRTQEEWDTGHVASAVHIPHGELSDRIAEVTEDKNARIVLYCKAGGRAGRAKKALEQLGFTNVENAGGYEDIKDRFATE